MHYLRVKEMKITMYFKMTNKTNAYKKSTHSEICIHGSNTIVGGKKNKLRTYTRLAVPSWQNANLFIAVNWKQQQQQGETKRYFINCIT